jgi:curli production assembly/transport component CsgF
MKKILLLISIAFCACSLYGQDLVYRPVNPAFGGETFNYNWLFSSAQAQDLIEDPDNIFDTDASTLDDFAESLNRQLLNQLSRDLITSQFGEDGIQEGNFVFGDFQVDISTGLDGLIVNIFDASIGEQTQVIIPFF